MGNILRDSLGDVLDEEWDRSREDELLAKLVHDLKNPLGVIASFAEEVPLVQEGERREFCQRLVVNARRALRVLDDFGLVSDLRRSRVALTLGPCDWVSLVGAGLEEVAELARESDQHLAFVHDGEVSMVGDAPLLRSALGSMLRETLAGVGKRRRVEVEVQDQGEWAGLRICVPDRKDGFPEASPFTSDAIGMELARRVFELHRGSLAVRRAADAAVASIQIPRLPGACKGSA